MIRGEVFIFKGSYVWRLGPKLKLVEGYPTLWKEVFPIFPENVTRIDAVYERDNDSSIVFFTSNNFYLYKNDVKFIKSYIGSTYWVFDGEKLIENSPNSIRNYGIYDNIDKIDAVMNWGILFLSKFSSVYLKILIF